MAVPRKKKLIGHAHDHDVYETPGHNIYLYSGSSKQDWKKQKYWKKVR